MTRLTRSGAPPTRSPESFPDSFPDPSSPSRIRTHAGSGLLESRACPAESRMGAWRRWHRA
jgi:hypothetical protein